MQHRINIILTRHGRYDRTEDKKLGGHITKEGKKEIEERTNERIQTIVGNNLNNTMFLVIGSPTYWLSKECYGQRAIETQNITKETIKKILQEHGINDISKHFYNQKALYTTKSKINILEISKMLSEPNVYDEAPEYVRKLKLKHNGMTEGFWKEFSSSEEAKKYSIKAETPSVLHKKIKMMLQYVINWSREYSKQYNSDICVILITHGETIQPFLNNSKISKLYGGNYNEGVIFEVGDDNILVRPERIKYMKQSIDCFDR